MELIASSITLLIAVFALPGRSLAGNRVGDYCEIYDFTGKCKLPEDCESFKLEDIKEIEKYRSTNCGFLEDLRTMVICCPETSTNRMAQNLETNQELAASQTACNKLEDRKDKTPRILDDHIFRGVYASDNEFPQFAALAYKKNDDAELRFGCGGVLISENFVLTAAHCITIEDPIKFVRLGTTNLKSEKFKTDVDVKRQIRHSSYSKKRKYHDIGLLELEKNVIFTHYIWPACLYQGNELPSDALDIAGFGHLADPSDGGKLSERLMKATVAEVIISECNSTYTAHHARGLSEFPNGINENLICANDKTVGSSTCIGDSGSGLHRKFNNTYEKRFVVGITSSGPSCASPLPSFYTRIYPHLEWIEEIVWPKNKTNQV